ncbi:MAG: 2-oxo acid dehydrogenase subunit E2, partial [Chloroflexota bacterium]
SDEKHEEDSRPTMKILIPEEIETAEEVVIVTWLKREGSTVEEGEVLVIIQSDKIDFELPALVSGTLTSILVQQGEIAKVDQPLGELEPSGGASSPAPEATKTESKPVAEPKAPARDIRASPIAKRLARENGIDLAQVTGTGKEGRISEKDIQAFIDAQSAPAQSPAPKVDKQDIVASPVAKRIAKENGIDLSDIPGAGDRRLSQKDVLAYIESQGAGSQGSSALAGSGQTIPMAGMRATIAQRMHQSLQEMAQLTLHTEVDVTDMVTLRTRLKETQPITYTDLLIKASIQALQAHPHVNATLKGDSIHLLPEINIGIAVALESGLIVPNIKNANQKSLTDLCQDRRKLVEKSRNNQLSASDYTGGTFTITNLGTYDIDGFTPIINPPEIAILGVGRIVEKVVVHEGKVAQRSMMTLSLSFDHRLVDGAPAAAFLKTIKENLENPARLE